MKSEVTVFGYRDAKDNVTVRRLFVMHKTDAYLQGFDMDLLNNRERKWVYDNLDNHEVKMVYTNGYSEPRRIKNIDEAMMKKLISKSWKTFKTDRMEAPYLSNSLQFLLTKDQLVDFIGSRTSAKRSSVRRNINAVIHGKSGKTKRYSAYGYKIAKIVTGYGLIPKEM